MKIIKLSPAKILYYILHLFLISLFVNAGYSQNKTNEIKNLSSDYKILNSNESFIELEFYPEFKTNSDFTNAVSNTSRYGVPDVRFRSFPVYFPGTLSNRVEITDSKFTDIPNVEIGPVPSLKNSKDKDAVVPVYNKDEKIYSDNNFFPRDAASLSDVGILRNKYFG
ncbi:MAG: C25 family peptidase propeptide domain-containing protein, partial [bacterium]